MNRVVSFFSKGIGFAYAMFRRLVRKKERIQNNQILIIATGHIGNAVVDAPAIDDLIAYYKKTGKKVFLLCSKAMKTAFELTIDLSDVVFLGEKYHYSGVGTYFHAVKQTLDGLKDYEFETVLVTLTSCDPLAHYIAACVPANESWGLFDDAKQKYGYFRHFFERYYTNKLVVPIDMQEAQRLKLLLEKLGCKGHQTRIQYIPVQMDYPKRAPYITVTVDSMSTPRRWVSEKFVELIRRMLDIYPYDVYLTGNCVPESDAALYKDAFQNQPRVKNCVGKTSFSEWIEMLRHSQFHIGVDSGSIHVAASVGTQAFCLTGVWDGKRMMPYKVDQPDARTVEPICVYRSDVNVDSLPCYACKVRNTRIGRGNDACYRACMSGRPCFCLQKIEVDDVIKMLSSKL